MKIIINQIKTMQRIWLTLVLCSVITLPVNAAIPNSIDYQGYITGSGAPLNGTVGITFKLYGTSTGGVALWTDSQLVAVNKGLFSVRLGSAINPVPESAFSNALWLGVTVSGDAEMTPRSALTTAPYAFKANDADTLAGQSISTLDQSAPVAGLQTDVASLQSQLDSALQAITNLQAANAVLSATVSSIQANSVLALDGVLTLNGTAAQFSGVNVQIINGLGSTGTTNSLGNLIVGYAEDGADTRTGSHNLVVGPYHSYSSYGGLLAGYDNTTSGNYASVTGGEQNTANGIFASISGGRRNTASGGGASVSGGDLNTASLSYTSISGGYLNTASASWASVSGGFRGTASGPYSSVSGGYNNNASGSSSSIVGGESNTASANGATIGGGRSNRAMAASASVSGGFANTASADMASVSGGQYNTASGGGASVSGGQYNQAIGISSSVAGGGGPATADGNLALGDLTTILGGVNNLTGSGTCDGTGCSDSVPMADQTQYAGATVSGGVYNKAANVGASVSGGHRNLAGALWSSVSGGERNSAYGNGSNVSGGYINTVSGAGHYSSISGGDNNVTAGEYSSVTGGRKNVARGIRSTIVGGGGGEAAIEALFADDPIYDGFNGRVGNETLGENSVIVGGISNVAHGIGTVITGGWYNEASGRYDVIVGGLWNTLDMGTSVLVGGKQGVSKNQFAEQSLLAPSGLYAPFDGPDTSSVIVGTEGNWGNVYIGHNKNNINGSEHTFFFAAPACPSGNSCTVLGSSSKETSSIPQELQDATLCTVAGVVTGGAGGAACVIGVGFSYIFDIL